MTTCKYCGTILRKPYNGKPRIFCDKRCYGDWMIAHRIPRIQKRRPVSPTFYELLDAKERTFKTLLSRQVPQKRG